MPNNLKKEIFLKLAVVLYIIATLNFLADYFHLYYILWWFDMLMHFLGGFWVGGMAIWFYLFNSRINGKFAGFGTAKKLVFYWRRRARETGKRPFVFPSRGANIVLYFAAVMAVSLVWELFEFSLDTFVVSRTNDIMDTLSDLFMDALGAGSMLTYFFYGKYRNTMAESVEQLISKN